MATANPTQRAQPEELVRVSPELEAELVEAIDESYEEQRLGTLTPAWEHLRRARPGSRQRRAG
jgi:hypothetical protein